MEKMAILTVYVQCKLCPWQVLFNAKIQHIFGQCGDLNMAITDYTEHFTSHWNSVNCNNLLSVNICLIQQICEIHCNIIGKKKLHYFSPVHSTFYESQKIWYILLATVFTNYSKHFKPVLHYMWQSLNVLLTRYVLLSLLEGTVNIYTFYKAIIPFLACCIISKDLHMTFFCLTIEIVWGILYVCLKGMEGVCRIPNIK